MPPTPFQCYMESLLPPVPSFVPALKDIKIGRSSRPGRIDIVIDDPFLSGEHAYLTFLSPTDPLRKELGTVCVLTDVSRNGCWVNGHKVPTRVPTHLKMGDVLLLSKGKADPTSKPPVLGRIAFRFLYYPLVGNVGGKGGVGVAKSLPPGPGLFFNAEGKEEGAVNFDAPSGSSQFDGDHEYQGATVGSQYEAPFSQNAGEWLESQVPGGGEGEGGGGGGGRGGGGEADDPTASGAANHLSSSAIGQ